MRVSWSLQTRSLKERRVKIPEDFINRIQKAADRVRECVQIAAELVSALKERGFSGVNISTIGWEDKLPTLLSAAGISQFAT